MEIHFVAQPHDDGSNLFEFIEGALGDTEITELRALSAWAKFSGLARIQHSVHDLRGRGGTAQLIVGIDEGGATEQGLRLALDAFDEVYVLHDPSGRTFHPKVYLATGTEAAYLLVGSNNLTAGGVYFNYEGALRCDLDLAQASDKKLVDEVVRYIDRLRGDGNVCKELTDAVLKELVENPKYRIRDERAQRRKTKTGARDVDSEVDEEAPAPAGLFDASSEAKKSPPGVSVASLPSPTVPVTAAPTPATPSAGASGVAGSGSVTPTPGAGTRAATGLGASTTPAATTRPAVTKRWFRKLSSSDAQQAPSAATNPTGVVRLNQAGHPIDQTVFFRHDFFGGVAWTSQPTARGPKDSTVIAFDVTINGNGLGTTELLVDHAAFREANQNNVTTVLHWGELNAAMRAQNYTEHFLVLELLSDGSFRLEITPNQPPSFIK